MYLHDTGLRKREPLYIAALYPELCDSLRPRASLILPQKDESKTSEKFDMYVCAQKKMVSIKHNSHFLLK